MALVARPRIATSQTVSFLGAPSNLPTPVLPGAGCCCWELVFGLCGLYASSQTDFHEKKRLLVSILLRGLSLDGWSGIPKLSFLLLFPSSHLPAARPDPKKPQIKNGLNLYYRKKQQQPAGCQKDFRMFLSFYEKVDVR